MVPKRFRRDSLEGAHIADLPVAADDPVLLDRLSAGRQSARAGTWFCQRRPFLPRYQFEAMATYCDSPALARALHQEQIRLQGNDQPTLAGWAGLQNGTVLHQPPQIPGSGDFLPKFLPKQAPLLN